MAETSKVVYRVKEEDLKKLEEFLDKMNKENKKQNI